MRVYAILLFAGAIGVSACGGSASSPSSSTPATAPSGSTSVNIVLGASGNTTNAYNPNPVTVAVGTTVSWLNSDNTVHTVDGDTGVFASPDIAVNDRFNFTFTTKGTFPYHCSIHPNMVGTVIVQ